MDESELSELLRIKSRYDHTVVMAIETLCTCNSARQPLTIARELCEYLLADDHAVKCSLVRDVSLRGHHCIVHSPRLSTRPWFNIARNFCEYSLSGEKT
jgi:hypothetical protein